MARMLESYIRALHENPDHKDLTPAERHEKVCAFMRHSDSIDNGTNHIIEIPVNYTFTESQANLYRHVYDAEYNIGAEVATTTGSMGRIHTVPST